MTDRTAELRELAATLREREEVLDAFVAKSFTDQLVIVDVAGPLPSAVSERLGAADVEPADAVYGAGKQPDAGVGDVGEGTRHHFVDVRTRGTHQSYVIE